MKKFIKIAKIILINIVLLVSLLEIVSMIYIKIKAPLILDYEQIPTYLDILFDKNKSFKNILFDLDSIKVEDPISPHYIDTSYAWCTWHPKNSICREKSDCFDVIYKFNELGTRSSLPDSSNSNTIIFVGDSFVEGFGINEDSTASERIRHRLNMQVLNLGTSGNIGTTQMSLIYDEFAKHFKHKNVYVLFFLGNDFIENNVINHAKYFSKRFRPYRILKKDTSFIVYKGSKDSSESSWNYFNTIKQNGFYIKQPHFLFNENLIARITKLSYSRRLISYIKFNIINSFNKTNLSNKPDELKYSIYDWKILELDIKSIIKIASLHNARVSFINLPSHFLFKYTKKSKKNLEEYKQLEFKLDSFIRKNGGRYLSFFDFQNKKKVNTELLFFSCNMHYSNYGVAILSDFIVSTFSNN